MSDSHGASIGPVPPVGGSPSVQPVRPEPSAPTGAGLPANAHEHHEVAAITGGNVPPAYAQLVVNPDTHDVIIRVRDARTDEVIREYPSKEVEVMAKYLKEYTDALARRRAAARGQDSGNKARG